MGTGWGWGWGWRPSTLLSNGWGTRERWCACVFACGAGRCLWLAVAARSKTAGVAPAQSIPSLRLSPPTRPSRGPQVYYVMKEVGGAGGGGRRAFNSWFGAAGSGRGANAGVAPICPNVGSKGPRPAVQPRACCQTTLGPSCPVCAPAPPTIPNPIPQPTPPCTTPPPCRQVYSPLELLLFVAGCCTIADSFLPQLIGVPKATVNAFVRAALSMSFVLGAANVRRRRLGRGAFAFLGGAARSGGRAGGQRLRPLGAAH